ncbi:hypothetical protein [Pyruvatibacter mobilis]|uniref:hypothetical protein n=1 Tax=Pyruvatibacter mobilis TaxID=1712261 RepID=UPI003D0B4673
MMEQVLKNFLDFWDQYERQHDGGVWHAEDLGKCRCIESVDLEFQEGGPIVWPHDRKDREKIKRTIARNLGPIPYCGNLRKAKIVILQCNPSVSDFNYREEIGIEGYSGRCWREINEGYGFVFANEMFGLKNPGAFNWWYPQVAPAVGYVRAKLMEGGKETGIEDVWSKVRENICTIDLVAYRSKKEPENIGNLLELESTKIAIELGKCFMNSSEHDVFVHIGRGAWRKALKGCNGVSIDEHRTSTNNPVGAIIGNCPRFREALMNRVFS